MSFEDRVNPDAERKMWQRKYGQYVRDYVSLARREIVPRYRIDIKNPEYKQWDNHTQEEIDEDIANLEEKRGRRDPNQEDSIEYLTAQAYESILLEQIGDEDWYGPSLVVIPTSDVDDELHGIDLAILVRDTAGNAVFAIGMDATFSRPAVQEKVLMARDRNIRDGKMTRIKYPFVRDIPEAIELMADGTSEIQDVPLVIVPLSIRTVGDLVENRMLGKRDNLSRHPARRAIAEMIQAQLEAFASYAARLEPDRSRVAEQYTKASGAFKPILQKVRSEQTNNPLADDYLYKELMLKLTALDALTTPSSTRPVLRGEDWRPKIERTEGVVIQRNSKGMGGHKPVVVETKPRRRHFKSDETKKV